MMRECGCWDGIEALNEAYILVCDHELKYNSGLDRYWLGDAQYGGSKGAWDRFFFGRSDAESAYDRLNEYRDWQEDDPVSQKWYVDFAEDALNDAEPKIDEAESNLESAWNWYWVAWALMYPSYDEEEYDHEDY